MVKNHIKKCIKSEKGQALVEFALLLPFLLFILMATIDFGWTFFCKLNVDNATRETARTICVGYDDRENLTPEEAVTGGNQAVAQATAESCLLSNLVHDETSAPDAPVSPVVTLTESADHNSITVEVKAEMKIVTYVLDTINNRDESEEGYRENWDHYFTLKSSATFKIERPNTEESTTS